MHEFFNNEVTSKKDAYNEFDGEKTSTIDDIRETNTKYQNISKIEREKLINQYNIRNEKCNYLFEQIKKIITDKDLVNDITTKLGSLLHEEFQSGSDFLEIINESDKQIDYFNEIIFELTQKNLTEKEITPKVTIDSNFTTITLNPRNEIKKYKYIKDNQPEILLTFNNKYEEIKKRYYALLDTLLVKPELRNLVDNLHQLMNEQHQDTSNLFCIFINMNEHIDILNELVINASDEKENLLGDDIELMNHFK